MWISIFGYTKENTFKMEKSIKLRDVENFVENLNQQLKHSPWMVVVIDRDKLPILTDILAPSHEPTEQLKLSLDETA